MGIRTNEYAFPFYQIVYKALGAHPGNWGVYQWEAEFWKSASLGSQIWDGD